MKKFYNPLVIYDKKLPLRNNVFPNGIPFPGKKQIKCIKNIKGIVCFMSIEAYLLTNRYMIQNPKKWRSFFLNRYPVSQKGPQITSMMMKYDLETLFKHIKSTFITPTLKVSFISKHHPLCKYTRSSTSILCRFNSYISKNYKSLPITGPITEQMTSMKGELGYSRSTFAANFARYSLRTALFHQIQKLWKQYPDLPKDTFDGFFFFDISGPLHHPGVNFELSIEKPLYNFVKYSTITYNDQFESLLKNYQNQYDSLAIFYQNTYLRHISRHPATVYSDSSFVHDDIFNYKKKSYNQPKYDFLV